MSIRSIFFTCLAIGLFWALAILFKNNGSVEIIQKAELSSNLCSLDAIEDYMNKVYVDRCKDNKFGGAKCMFSFNWVDALTIAPFFAAGPGGVSAAAGRMTVGGAFSGISQRDHKTLQEIFGETNSKSKIQTLRTQYGYDCGPDSEFMILKEDLTDSDEYKYDEFENDSDSPKEKNKPSKGKLSINDSWVSNLCVKKENFPVTGFFDIDQNQKKRRLTFAECQTLMPNVSKEKCEFEAREVVKNGCRLRAKEYFCEPQKVIRDKTINFLQSSKETRNKALCGSRQVFNYYHDLLENFFDEIKKTDMISNIRCNQTKLVGFQVMLNNKYYLYKIFYSNNGHLAAILARPNPIEELPEYQRWIKFNALKKANLPSGTATTNELYISEEVELKPGELFLLFNQKPGGDQLTSVSFVNGPDFSKKIVQVPTTDISKFFSAYQNSNFHVDFKNLGALFSGFSLNLDSARSCCEETDPSRRSYCMQKMHGEDIGSASGFDISNQKLEQSETVESSKKRKKDKKKHSSFRPKTKVTDN